MRRDEPLSRWTTLRLGGAAEFFFEPRTPDDLWKLLTRLDEDGVPYRMLGGGANVLAPDGGVPGAVIHTGSMRRIFRDGETEKAEELEEPLKTVAEAIDEVRNCRALRPLLGGPRARGAGGVRSG